MSTTAQPANASAAAQSTVAELRKLLLAAQRELWEIKHTPRAAVDEVINAAYAATVAQAPVPMIPAPPRDLRRKGKPEVGLIAFKGFFADVETDDYNADLMHEWVGNTLATWRELVEVQRNHHPVRDGIVLLGGGWLANPLPFDQPLFQLTAEPFVRWQMVARELLRIIQTALSLFERVTVISEHRNPGRQGQGRAAKAVPENTDVMTYRLVRRLLEPEVKAHRLVWKPADNDRQYFSARSGSAPSAHRAMLIWGDEYGRTGHVSEKTLEDSLNAELVGGKKFRDVYVCRYGVYRKIALANGEGSIYYLPGFGPADRYAHQGRLHADAPIVVAHFIEPKAGFVRARYLIEANKGVVG